jgi:drug/metabolite transporter (DMT)-like permease
MGVDQYLQQLNSRYPNIAYFYAIIGNVFLAFMNIFFKFLTKIASPLQMLFMRSFSLLILNTWVLDGKSPCIANPKSNHLFILAFRLVILRIICTSGSSAIMHYCVKSLPVSIVATLYNTSPIFIYFV